MYCFGLLCSSTLRVVFLLLLQMKAGEHIKIKELEIREKKEKQEYKLQREKQRQEHQRQMETMRMEVSEHYYLYIIVSQKQNS